MTPQGAEASNAVVTGMIYISHVDALVLFDPGSTHSYVSREFAPCLGIEPSALERPMMVATPTDIPLVVDTVYRGCVITVAGRDTIADLILLGNMGFDSILGMDWLASCHVTLDCRRKKVCFNPPMGDRFCLQWDQPPVAKDVISVLEAGHLLNKGCQAFLALVR